MQRLQGQGEPVTVHTYSDYRHTVVVPNATAQDSSLSWAARGLLVYMLSMPEHWRFNEHDLVNRSPMGRDHLRSIVRELEAHGYLLRQRRYDARGRRTTSHWEVWAKPVAAVQTAGEALQQAALAPQTENPSVDRRPAAKTTDGKPVGGEIPVVPTGLSTDGFPGPGFPPTENPSVYKKNNQQKPHKKKNPPVSPQTELPVTAKPPAAAIDQGEKRRKAEQVPNPTAADLPPELAHCAKEFLEWWQVKKGSLSRISLNRAANFLLRYTPEQRLRILESATMAGWQGLYPPSETRATGSGSQPQPRLTKQQEQVQIAREKLRRQAQANLASLGIEFSGNQPPQSPALSLQPIQVEVVE